MSASNGRHSMVSAILADNEITSASTPEAERVSGASLVGLWLLIPVAIGAAAYAILGIVSMLTTSTGLGTDPAAITWQWWLGLTLGLQVIYWMLLAPRPLAGLWAIIPVIALIPTFFVARDVLLDRRVRALGPAAPESGRDSSSGKSIWIEPEE